jgi:FMN phosphatase YigB (HAD superfamily)
MAGPVCDRFLAAWQIANRTIDFPFASHFLQEPPWIDSALDAASVAGDSGPAILALYRTHVAHAVASQPQLPLLRGIFEWLRANGVPIFVASNDRAFATPAMLRWAGFDRYVQRVFVSEALSQSYPGAEKPNVEFFTAIARHEGWTHADLARVAYIGDSEARDVIPASASGMVAVRYLVRRQDGGSGWRDDSAATAARYSYDDRAGMKPVLSRVLADMGYKLKT